MLLSLVRLASHFLEPVETVLFLKLENCAVSHFPVRIAHEARCLE